MLRALLPPVVALATSAAVLAGATAILPAGGAVLALGLFAGGVAVPIAAAALERRAGVAVAAERVGLAIDAVDVAETAEELAAYGAGDERLAAVAARERRLVTLTRREARALAFGDGVEGALGGAVAATLLVVGAGAVRDGRLGSLLLAALVLLGWALPEIVGTLPVASRRAKRSARRRRTRHRRARCRRPGPRPRGHRARTRRSARRVGARARRAVARRRGDATLVDVDLDLPPGSRTVLVGPSGAGKSTLAAALVRFVPFERGTVTIGGVDVTQLPGDAVRRLVGWCAQDAHFFDATIADNLRIARPDATDAQLVAAVHARCGWARGSTRSPTACEPRVGVAGTQLSGGEAQRLALARELLADRPVVVLDEPTANVDAGAADALTRDLLAAAGGRTVLMITHRTTGLEGADRVVVLEGGRTRVVAPVPVPRVPA